MVEPRLLRAGEVIAERLNGTARVLGRLLHDLEVTAEEPIPTDRAVVVAANHFSHLDPVLVTIAAHRNVRYLAVDELFGRSRLFDTTTGMFGAIPLPRDGVPLGALRTALGHLAIGGAVGVFPEGRRVAEWGEEDPKRGAAWLSLRTGAPLYPLAIAGSLGTMSPREKRVRRTPIRVWSGRAIHPDGYLDRVDPLGAMMRDWHAWMDERLAPWVSTPLQSRAGREAPRTQAEDRPARG